MPLKKWLSFKTSKPHRTSIENLGYLSDMDSAPNFCTDQNHRSSYMQVKLIRLQYSKVHVSSKLPKYIPKILFDKTL